MIGGIVAETGEGQFAAEMTALRETTRECMHIEITEMMYRLRCIAIKLKLKKQPGMIFTQSFLEVIKAHGRTFEAELLLRYSLATNPLSLLRQVGFGLTMFSRGKVSPLPDRIEGRDEVRAILSDERAQRSG
jgi:hypothetical protein